MKNLISVLLATLVLFTCTPTIALAEAMPEVAATAEEHIPTIADDSTENTLVPQELDPVNYTWADVTSAGITIGWYNVDDATSYAIYRVQNDDYDESADLDYKLIKSHIPPSDSYESSYTDTDQLVAGAVYSYVVVPQLGDVIDDIPDWPSVAFATAPGQKQVVAAPTGLKITDVNANIPASISLSWTAAENATYYNIHRAESKNGPFQIVEEHTAATSYRDTTLQMDKEYFYKVTSVYYDSDTYDYIESDFSNTVSKMLTTPGLTNVKIAGYNLNSITITWNSFSTLVKNFEIHRSTDGTNFKKIATISIYYGYTDENLTYGNTYSYKVRAIFQNGTTEDSQVVSARPELLPPGKVTATSLSTSSIKVSWNSVSSAAQYWLYRSTKKDSGFKVIKKTSATSFTDKNLKMGTKYYYKVKSVNGSIQSNMSAAASASPTFKGPSSLKAQSVDYKSIKLTWGSISGADKYVVFRSDNSGSTYKRIKTLNNDKRIYTDANLSTGKTYYYKVCAQRNSINSGFSKAAKATPRLGAVKNISCQPASKQVTLTWSKVKGADKYVVLRATSNDGTYTQVASLGNVSSFTDKKGLANNKAYYYKIIPYRGKTAGNTPANGTRVVVKPVPLNITVQATGQNGDIKISWNKVSGATKYKVMRLAKHLSFNYVTATTTASTSYLDTSLEPGKKYTYKIIPVMSNGKNGSSSSAKSVTARASAIIEKVLNTARANLGKPYVLGANGPDSFDCTGIVYYCYRQAGVQVPRFSSYDWCSTTKYPSITSQSALRPGDVICRPGHALIYMGGGKAIEATLNMGLMYRDVTWTGLAKRISA